MSLITCQSIYGNEVEIEAERLIFRPAAYGVITHEDKILLVNTRSTGKWFFPGGGVEKGETAETALKREVSEEAGIQIAIDKFLQFQESFFYYDPWDKAFQNFSFIYRCRPLSTELSDANNEEGDEGEKPQWVPINDLKPEDFQAFAGDIFNQYLLKN